MICLTGDIHHASLGTNEQRYINNPRDSEVRISARYLDLVENFKVKVTFYVTGKTLADEWQDFKEISASELVELGGHTYSGIPLGAFSKLAYRIRGRTPPSHSPTYGSRRNQRTDIRKMIDIAGKRTGKDIVSWRSHGYVHDSNTYSILAEMGIKMISDEISNTRLFPFRTSEGLISHPINVMPDHDHIYHAHRDREFVEKAGRNGYGADAFSSDSYTVEEWGDIVEKQVVEIEKRNGLATVLMHPICMYLADGFKTAARLLKVFSGYKTIRAKEIPAWLNGDL